MKKLIHKWLLAVILIVFLLASINPIVSASGSDNTLRLGLTKGEFTIMNPVAQPWHDANFFGVTHVPLVIFKPDFDIAPGLAKDWSIAPDGKSVKFSLIANATWSDGTPVTAEDVAFTIDYWRENKIGAEGIWYESYLDRVDVLDNSTVNIILKQPVAFDTLISEIPGTYILPKHIWENVKSAKDYDGADAMVGCGPFIFEKFDKDAEVVFLKANDKYFAGNRP